jgi:peptide deformylase
VRPLFMAPDDTTVVDVVDSAELGGGRRSLQRGPVILVGMAIRPIVRLGDPVLRTPADPVAHEQIGSPELEQLIDDMIETMRDAEGVGLAAPQVGVPLQIFVFEWQPSEDEEDEQEEPLPAEDEEDEPLPAEDAPFRSEGAPLTVVLNPMLTLESTEAVFDWEGCLSIPDLRGLVPRNQSVRLRGFGRHGEELDAVWSDFAARIIQHEFDHLNGVIFLDRMRDMKSLAFREEWERFLAARPGSPEPS